MRTNSCLYCGNEFATDKRGPQRYCDLECRAAARRQRRKNPECHEKLRERYANDAEFREKERERKRELRRSPEYRERERNRQREQYKDFEYRCNRALQKSVRVAEKYGYAPCNATAEQIMEAFTGDCHKCGVAESDCKRRLAVDHCHDTGDFRGWLCSGCNKAMGLLGDTPQQVWEAYAYLAPSHATIALLAHIPQPPKRRKVKVRKYSRRV